MVEEDRRMKPDLGRISDLYAQDQASSGGPLWVICDVCVRVCVRSDLTAIDVIIFNNAVHGGGMFMNIIFNNLQKWFWSLTRVAKETRQHVI